MTDIQTAPEPEAPAATAPERVDAAAVVTAVTDAVQSHPDVHPHRAAGVATDVLAALYEAQPAIFAVSRASPRSQAQAALGLGLAEILVGALLRRRA